MFMLLQLLAYQFVRPNMNDESKNLYEENFVLRKIFSIFALDYLKN